MSDDKKFAGFAQPKENWSKLPHALIDELANITSESELKVILYILRHTWGYHDSEKKITIDEFCNGRKRSDGSRIDAGCGITANSVKSGIENAVNHGYIVVEEDARDKARIKRFYSINSGGQLLTVGGQLLTPWVSEVDPRTEKDTLERNSSPDDDLALSFVQRPPATLTPKARPTPPVPPPPPAHNGNGASAASGNRDGRMLMALVQGRGFMYLDSQASTLAMRLETDYTDAQLRTALDKVQEAHQKQIKTGQRGITAPLAYMSQVLAGMDMHAEPAKDKNVVNLFTLLENANQ